MIVLDASVVIAALNPQDAVHGRAQALLVDLLDEDLSMHALTRAEVLVAPARADRLRLAEQRLDALVPGMIALSGRDAADLAGLRASTGLTLPDCCVIQAAIDARAAVATFDDRLARAARALGLEVVGDA